MDNLVLELNARGAFTGFNSSTTDAARMISRLDALLLYLKTCQGRQCRTSWNHLFPYGKVSSLKEALDPKYDAHFDSLPKVAFGDCALGYHSALLLFQGAWLISCSVANELPYWSTNLPFYQEPPSIASGAVELLTLQCEQ
jgi:hypothetical protein